ncbi:hypothetical protein EDI_111820 [Entamoeba dispar SAW760]|uniref:HORMA domain-containing protein n=1 Tax=Entamoeba dispar (strain ATCC PRA-260 / SAW760) TaxID=370354 RepID=B0E6E2_ENTDS|nr:uncharacterized protein EDI_111820 [Entamoeba dispar SAW760]EDR29900.1 hypothetical protein EDI_111820 [Entamoeba dispar SAW760]|eukprot:EDR29900.1 hypothetical protein EDI_111820 [Entamoeba dispar SAW760]
MSKKLYNQFLEDYISTVLYQSHIYPDYCFKRVQLQETVAVYRPISLLLKRYIEQVVSLLPQFQALKIQIQKLPTLTPIYEWFLLNTFSIEHSNSVFESILHQRVLCDYGTVTFQISALTHQSNSKWKPQEVEFFGDTQTLQPINELGCCVLFRHF